MQTINIIIDLTNNEGSIEEYLEQYDLGYKIKTNNQNYTAHIVGLLEDKKLICTLAYNDITLNEINQDFSNIFGEGKYKISIIQEEEESEEDKLKYLVRDALKISYKKSGQAEDEIEGYTNYVFIKKIKSKNSILKDAPEKGDYYIIRFKDYFQNYFDKTYLFYLFSYKEPKLIYFGTGQPFTKIDTIKKFIYDTLIELSQNYTKKAMRTSEIKKIYKKYN